jgi:hypothetical protein
MAMRAGHGVSTEEVAKASLNIIGERSCGFPLAGKRMVQPSTYSISRRQVFGDSGSLHGLLSALARMEYLLSLETRYEKKCHFPRQSTEILRSRARLVFRKFHEYQGHNKACGR